VRQRSPRPRGRGGGPRSASPGGAADDRGGPGPPSPILGRMDAGSFAAALAAIVRRLDAGAGDEVEATIAEALPRLLEVDGDDEAGSLGRADLYRIRSGKLIARLLPPG